MTCPDCGPIADGEFKIIAVLFRCDDCERVFDGPPSGRRTTAGEDVG
jgi:uncharacterized Zn finger protein